MWKCWFRYTQNGKKIIVKIIQSHVKIMIQRGQKMLFTVVTKDNKAMKDDLMINDWS